MSKHQALVVKLPAAQQHPNAGNLEIFEILGVSVVARKGQWSQGSLAVLIESDYLVDGGVPEFTFMGDGVHRIKPKRLRGVWSEGLLVPVREGMREGDNALTLLGVRRWEPPVSSRLIRSSGPDGLEVSPPACFVPVYDLEPYHRNKGLLSWGEEAIITEKLHGAQARYVWVGNRLHVGSRNRWLHPLADTVWHRALSDDLVDLFSAHDRCVFYGEVFGCVQDLKYEFTNGEVAFRCFDVFDQKSGFMTYGDRTSIIDWCSVSLLYRGPLSEDTVAENTNGYSLYASHIREGCVVESADRSVKLKAVSNEYLSRSK